jgi:bifunctional enzyme CysN/CysC
MPRDLLRIVTAGSVDDGKSTLIGRLLYDAGGIYEDQLQSVGRASTQGALDLALLTDGLRAEREQGITIDVAYRYFSTTKRHFIIGDTPGHEQYTRNMATGASTAQVALLLLDARKGVLPQTIRHTCIAYLLGIRRIVVAINKMDMLGFRQEVFESISKQFEPLRLKMPDMHFYFVPTVATDGDNVAQRSRRLEWFEGCTIIEYLENLPTVARIEETQPFRMAVQYVLRGPDYRAYSGRIASGRVVPGDELLLLPSQKKVRVSRLPSLHGDLDEAFALMSVSLCLSEQVDVSRGDMFVAASEPPETVRSFQAKVVWMSEAPLVSGRRLLLKHTSHSVCGEVTTVQSRLDLGDLSDQYATQLDLNDIGNVTVRTDRPLFCDTYRTNRTTGSFIFVDPITNLTVGAGMIEQPISMRESASALESSQGAVIWFTGLSSAGKTTLSNAVYERLWSHGHRVQLLDGDEVRLNLCHGLGFSKEDRNENIRRIGFVAELLGRHGVIVLVSAISPYREARDGLRKTISNFLEVYVNAPLQVCEGRDVKGLYRKARSGEIRHFTGIDDPYEPPLNPDVECRTDLWTVADCVDKVVERLDALLTGKAGQGTKPIEQN